MEAVIFSTLALITVQSIWRLLFLKSGLGHCHAVSVTKAFTFVKKKKKKERKKEIICLALLPPGATWNISNHWLIRAVVLMKKIDFVTFAISSLFLTAFSSGTSVIIQSLYSLLETPLGVSVYQPTSWKNIVICFTVCMYKYIHIRKGVSWSIWATITKYHSLGSWC